MALLNLHGAAYTSLVIDVQRDEIRVYVEGLAWMPEVAEGHERLWMTLDEAHRHAGEHMKARDGAA
jgi:hypothetical protein